MVTVRKTVWAGCVWLTAAMTLIAAAPRFVCRCPNGQVKSFCLGLASSTTGCCCDDGSCCPSGPDQPGCRCHAEDTLSAGESCCRQQQDQGTPEVPGTCWQAGGACCTKSPAQSSLFAPAPPKTTADDDSTLGLFVPRDTRSVFALVPVVRHADRCWCLQLLPPPTDLVVALQRFLI